MIEVSVTIEGITHATNVSEETKGLLVLAARISDTPEIWFLVETIQKYGELKEKNILSFLYWADWEDWLKEEDN